MPSTTVPETQASAQ